VGAAPIPPTGLDRPYTNGDTDMDEYTVSINGIEHTLLLSPEDAKRWGDNAVKKGSTGTKQSTAPATKKQAAPQNKTREE